jgi:hypothetical protein
MRYPLAILLALLLAAPALADSVNIQPLQSLPVLDHGRVKPIDTLARETVQFVTGSEFFGTVATESDGVRNSPIRAATRWIWPWIGPPAPSSGRRSRCFTCR